MRELVNCNKIKKECVDEFVARLRDLWGDKCVVRLRENEWLWIINDCAMIGGGDSSLKQWI